MYYSQGFKFHDYSPTLGDLATTRYPLFNQWWNTYIPEHRKTLEQKILHTYWFNQIGQDTPDKFTWMLNATLERIMPYYNQLYRSELIKFDPIMNHYIESTNSSVEEMVREANTGTSKAAKAIRDFVTSGNTIGALTENFAGTYDRTLDKDVVTDYTKDGTEDKIKDTVSHEDEVTETTRVTDFTSTVTEDETKDHDDTLNRTEVTDRDTVGNLKQTGTSETDENSSRTTSGTKSYADTPQRSVDTGAILSNYLTNYTATSETESTTRHSETDTTLNEDRTENVDQTVTTNETATHDEQNDKTTNTTSQETQKTDQTKTTDFTEKVTEDNEWHEEGHETEATDEYETSNTKEGTEQGTRQDTFRKDRDDKAESEATKTDEKEKQKTDENEEAVTKGFMNVSPSQLLAQFRDTFLNIDNMIIEELRPLFMEVF